MKLRIRESGMKKVLVINYGKGLRTRKFCTYLPLYGFDPTILTEARDSVQADGDNGNTKNLSVDSTKTVRARNFLHLERVSATHRFGLNYRFFFLPDPFISWIPNAYLKGVELCRKSNFDLIYVSCPPFSAAVVAYLLKKRFRIPLVCDFRDPWTLVQGLHMRYPSRLHKKIDQYVERCVLFESDHIITTSRAVAQDYSMLYPELRRKITTIRNGFDSTDFTRPRSKFEKFTITYTGSLGSSGDRPYGLFLKALRNLLDSRSIEKEAIKVLLVGSKTPHLIKDVKAHDLQTIVAVTERVPFSRALWCAASSSVLLLIELTNALPQKTYDYLATGVPILAIVREGELANLIRNFATRSYIVSTNNVQEISDNILAAYRNWQTGEMSADPNKMQEFGEYYERKNLTRELAKVFTSVTS